MSVNLSISSYIFEIIVTQIQYDVKKEKLICNYATYATDNKSISNGVN